jgi:hypothetical protein
MFQVMQDPSVDHDEALKIAFGCISDRRKVLENINAMATITAQYQELIQNVGPSGEHDLAEYLATTPDGDPAPNPMAGTPLGDLLDKKMGTPKFNAQNRDNTVLTALQNMSNTDSPFARAVAQIKKICDDPKSAAQAAFSDPRMTELIFDCGGQGGISDKKECARLRKRGTLAKACKLRAKEAWESASGISQFYALAPLQLDAVACVNFTGGVGKVFVQEGASVLAKNILTNAVRFEPSMLVGAGIGGGMALADYFKGNWTADDAALRFSTGSGSADDFKSGGKGPDLTENLSWVVLGMFAGKVFEPEGHIPESFAKVKSDLAEGSLSPVRDPVKVRSELSAPLIESGKITQVEVDKIPLNKLFGIFERTFEVTRVTTSDGETHVIEARQKLSLAKATGDAAEIDKASLAYLDSIDERLASDPERVKELERKYQDILDRTDPTQRNEMLAFLHAAESAGMEPETIKSKVKEVLKGLCDACGSCSKG